MTSRGAEDVCKGAVKGFGGSPAVYLEGLFLLLLHQTSQKHRAAQRSAAQRSTALHSTAQHSTAQHSTAHHCGITVR